MGKLKQKAKLAFYSSLLKAKMPALTAFDAATKISQISLFHQYQNALRGSNPPRFSDTGYRVFSQFDEDGRILFLLSVCGVHSRFFVDIGCGDGINSNCANLAVNLGFHGCMIDGSLENIELARCFYSNHPDTRDFPPQIIHAFIKAENIDEILKAASVPIDPDVLSVDIDGNDFYVWNAISVCHPRIIVIETHVELGAADRVVPYDPNYSYPGKHPQYHGASVSAMMSLGRKKGYRCVGTNNLGFNLFFVRDDLPEASILPEVCADEILEHARTGGRFDLIREIEDWPYTSSADVLR